MNVTIVAFIAVALAFDFFNGFHDAANSIATVVSTRVLSPRLAVAWAAFFNFAAFLIFGTAVASTIAKDVVVQNLLTNGVIFAGLVGAIVWDIITWYLGLPTSSSHALVGGMAGAAVASAGWKALVSAGPQKTAVLIVVSPITGAIVGVGTTQRLAAVRWGVAGRVVWAWVLTIPGAFIVAWLCYLPLRGLSG